MSTELSKQDDKDAIHDQSVKFERGSLNCALFENISMQDIFFFSNSFTDYKLMNSSHLVSILNSSSFMAVKIVHQQCIHEQENKVVLRS